ncbi:MAG TPA: metallopeptidase family protein [Candidatus Saccharimonadales bacterium]|nr:metallopeptidase family protein [Candidatus Saccharimonadales bacterium]
MTIDDQRFEAMISKALDELPEEYVKNLDNVAITYADQPTPEQRIKMKLKGGESLFGLYEGIPLTKRGAGYTFVLPDKITIFKHPMAEMTQTDDQLYGQVKHTLWHEVAHFYGLDHDRIHEIEARWR